MRRTLVTLGTVALVISVGACAPSSGEQEPLIEPDQGTSVTSAPAFNVPTPSLPVTSAPEVSVSVSAAPQASSPVAGTADRTADLHASVGDIVLSAVETEPGRLEVETTITDPRGDAGSPEAREAIAVCEAARDLGYEHVRVSEADGSTFVVAGHPSYGAACAEV
jgi:hypothetical protein